MWVVKSQSAKRLTPGELQQRAASRNERIIAGHQLMIFVSVVFEHDGQEITIEFFAENRQVITQTINNHLARLNEQEEVLTQIEQGTFVTEEVVPETVAEVEETEEMAEQKLMAELDRAKRMEEAEQVAQRNPRVAEALQQYNERRSTTVSRPRRNR